MGILGTVNNAQGPLRPDARQEQQIEVFHDNCSSTAFTFEPMHGRIPGDCASDLLRYRLCRCTQGRGGQLWPVGNQYYLGDRRQHGDLPERGHLRGSSQPGGQHRPVYFCRFRQAQTALLYPRPGRRCLLLRGLGVHALQQPVFRLRTNPPSGARHPGQPGIGLGLLDLPPCAAKHGPGLPGGNGHHRNPDGRDHGPDRR